MSNSTRPQRRLCDEISPSCPVELTTYGYYPNLGANAFFVALFGVCLIATLFLGIRKRTWTYMAVLTIGTFGEAVGYVGRILMHDNPWSDAGFKTQICCLVLAPSFLAAGIYVTLKHIVRYCGAEHSRLKPRLYPWIFIGCDFGSIILQAIGGGIAAGAGDNLRNPKLLDVGNGMIVAGIAFQVATMAVCGILMLDYFIRFKKAKKNAPTSHVESDYEKDQHAPKKARNFRLFCYAIALAYTTILIRCIYRIPEMAGGWGNPLMRNETEFLLLDGMMVAISCVAMTVVHPGYFCKPGFFDVNFKNSKDVGSQSEEDNSAPTLERHTESEK
ncbi:uncharacterized protein A1O9_03862 [Exophiala aquamarina CBS 119918]|uniref:Phospholipid-translocating ATPase n=1 Tax=Exophiala aquamarina CBS 119918 TaxID=1182545 RepID=A0A072PFW3_9EURO|nr:uncharacterized protein A1O9_03862 [Exophiala aquamarina CBS 119918]KEF59019.1 hypothetical protein A1O9_03862 [Exophiala aquamarina CBS 119918]